jgi:predicted metal-binding membrane protein
MSTSSRVEAVLQRDRAVAATALAVVVVASWAYILAGAGMGSTAFEMTGVDLGMHPMAPAPWTAGYAALVFAMWWVMMVGMMLPSAAPMILLYARVVRRRRGAASPYAPTGIFTLGYLAAWAGFSLVAAAVQWALEAGGLLSAMMAGTSTALGGGLLVAAGIWQLTPLKHACLKRCRSPIGFLSSHWRAGRLGAFRMGLEHGAFCLGCCWFLMALLFYGGVMNLYWIVGLALYVMAEKLLPAGHKISHVAAAILFATGAFLLLS